MNQSSRVERRAAPRFHATCEQGGLRARLRSGHEVALINISAGGALLESAHRLLPGARAELQVVTPSTRFEFTGRILRAEVCALASSTMRYRGAFQFDHPDERTAGSLGRSPRAAATRAQPQDAMAPRRDTAEVA